LLNEGLSFNANFVRQDSELQYPERPGEVLPLPRLSDNEMNLAFTYEKEKLFAQVKIAAEDDQVYQVAGDAESDRYFAPRGRVDLTVSYKLQKKSRVYVEWDNITNEPYLDIYEGERLYSTYHRLRPWSVTTGLKFEL
jgi:outer membrane receptor protein involved in Fe transport